MATINYDIIAFLCSWQRRASVLIGLNQKRGREGLAEGTAVPAPMIGGDIGKIDIDPGGGNTQRLL